MIDTAMILAAGRGERMRPLTDTMPKPMIPVAGRSMLDRSMDRLTAHGVHTIVVNVHHLGEQIAAHLIFDRGDAVTACAQLAEGVDVHGLGLFLLNQRRNVECSMLSVEC